jgi:hypothetical protein
MGICRAHGIEPAEADVGSVGGLIDDVVARELQLGSAGADCGIRDCSRSATATVSLRDCILLRFMGCIEEVLFTSNCSARF